MFAGRLRHRVRIERPATPLVRDSAGGVVTDTAAAWEVVADQRAAQVQPLSTRDRFALGAHTAEIDHRISLRFDPGITLRPDMRIIFGTRVFLVRGGPLHVREGRDEVQLLCQEQL